MPKVVIDGVEYAPIPTPILKIRIALGHENSAPRVVEIVMPGDRSRSHKEDGRAFGEFIYHHCSGEWGDGIIESLKRLGKIK